MMENAQEVPLIVPEIGFTLELELDTPAIAYIRVISSLDDKIDILGNTETIFTEMNKPTRFLKSFKIPYVVSFDHTQNVLFTVFCDDRLKTNNGFPLGNGEVRLIEIARKKTAVPIFIGTDRVGVVNVYTTLSSVEEKFDLAANDHMLSLGFKDSAPQMEAIKAKKNFVLEDAVSYVINISCHRFFNVDSTKLPEDKDYAYFIFFKILRKDSRLTDKNIVEKTLPYKPNEPFEQEWKVTHETLVGDEEYLSGRTELTVEMWVSEQLRGKVFDSYLVSTVVIPMRKVLGKAGYHSDVRFKSALGGSGAAEGGGLSLKFLPPSMRRASSNSSAAGSVASKGSSDEGGSATNAATPAPVAAATTTAAAGGTTGSVIARSNSNASLTSNSHNANSSSSKNKDKENNAVSKKMRKSKIRYLIKEFGTLHIHIDREITKKRYTAGSDVYERHMEELLTTSKAAWITKVFPEFSRAAQQVSKESHHAAMLLRLMHDDWYIAPVVIVDIQHPCLQSLLADSNPRLKLETNRVSCRVLDALLTFYSSLQPFLVDGAIQCLAGGYTTIPDLREEKKDSIFHLSLSPDKDSLSPGKEEFKLYNDQDEDKEAAMKHDVNEKYDYIRRVGLPHVIEALLPHDMMSTPLMCVADFCTQLFTYSASSAVSKQVISVEDVEKFRAWQRSVTVDMHELSRFSYYNKSHMYKSERELMQGFLEASVAYLPLVNVKKPKKNADDAISLSMSTNTMIVATTDAAGVDQSSTRRIASYTGSEYEADLSEPELLHLLPEFCKRGIRTMDHYDLNTLEALLMTSNNMLHVNVPIVWVLGRSPPLQQLRHFADILDRLYSSKRTDKSLIIILAPEHRYDFYSVSTEKLGELHMIAEPFKELITVFNNVKHQHQHTHNNDGAQNVHLLWYRNWSEVMAAAYLDDQKKIMSRSQKLDSRILAKLKSRKLPTISSLKAKMKVAFQHNPHIIKTILGEDETNIDQLIRQVNEEEYRNKDEMDDEISSVGSAAMNAGGSGVAITLRTSMSAALSQVAKARKTVTDAANIAKNAAKMAGNLAGNMLSNVIGGNMNGDETDEDVDEGFDIRDFKQLNAIKERFDHEIRLHFQRNLKDMLAKTLAKAAGHEGEVKGNEQQQQPLAKKASQVSFKTLRKEKSSKGQVELKTMEV